MVGAGSERRTSGSRAGGSPNDGKRADFAPPIDRVDRDNLPDPGLFPLPSISIIVRYSFATRSKAARTNAVSVAND
jgi:hypothetical protein